MKMMKMMMEEGMIELWCEQVKEASERGLLFILL